MKTPRKWNFKSMAGKVMMGLALAAMIISTGTSPAIAKNDKSHGRHDNGRYQHRGQGYNRQVHARPVYRPYGYYGHRERVYYPPPPVVYAPPPPPGIGIFFPPIIIHP
ncbi:MAG: hypothetical protein CVU71_09355 [Deltaproteobacteria bacterium HGW-Deltaproteobacteria-6]|jgi:hypothetical protein|nr:MAG: hypothetical protein CVU71_09355 [Deltaproteobacteria bacterium HGW-Deltaproteobacteria-6]